VYKLVSCASVCPSSLSFYSFYMDRVVWIRLNDLMFWFYLIYWLVWAGRGINQAEKLTQNKANKPSKCVR